ncbi:MAG: 4Fe-4S binding protein [Candidatus Saccharibacteria bacterium]
MSRRRYFRFWRTIIPSCIFVGTTIMLYRLFTYPLPADARGLLWLSRMDPLPLLGWIHGKTGMPEWLWLPLLVLVSALVLGRLFCGWLCPVGGLLGLVDSGQRPLARGPVRNKELGELFLRLRSIRYYWLGFLVLTILLGAGWPLLLTPFALLSHEVILLASRLIPWLLLILLFTTVTLFPRFWCTYLCPSGLLFSAFARWRRYGFQVNECCNKCGMCSRKCPTGAIQAAEGSVGEECILCGRCWEECPCEAVSWGRLRCAHKIDDATIETAASRDLEPLLSRRNVVQAGAVIITAGALWPISITSSDAGLLRPPGALPEREFSARCSRCERCIRVCPNQALQPVSIFQGIGYYDTPHLLPRKGRCDLDACFLCMEVCPTGAIQQVSLDKVKIGTADLDHGLCLNWLGQTRCLLCLEQCPVQAISADERQRPVVDSGLCVGCGACENGCPVSGAAVHIKLVK